MKKCTRKGAEHLMDAIPSKRIRETVVKIAQREKIGRGEAYQIHQTHSDTSSIACYNTQLEND